MNGSENGNYFFHVFLILFTILILVNPIVFQDAIAQKNNFWLDPASQSVSWPPPIFIVKGSYIMLEANLTSNSGALNATVQAVVYNETNQVLETLNSSITTLLPSIPILVYVKIPSLTPCSNYSVEVYALSATGAVLTPRYTIFLDPCMLFNNIWTLHSPLKVAYLYAIAINATFTNTLNYQILGIVFAVFHNQLSQPISIGADSLSVGPQESAIAYVVGNVPPGLYNVTVFAWLVNRASISPSYSIQV